MPVPGSSSQFFMPFAQASAYSQFQRAASALQAMLILYPISESGYLPTFSRILFNPAQRIHAPSCFPCILSFALSTRACSQDYSRPFGNIEAAPSIHGGSIHVFRFSASAFVSLCFFRTPLLHGPASPLLICIYICTFLHHVSAKLKDPILQQNWLLCQPARRRARRLFAFFGQRRGSADACSPRSKVGKRVGRNR